MDPIMTVPKNQFSMLLIPLGFFILHLLIILIDKIINKKK